MMDSLDEGGDSLEAQILRQFDSLRARGEVLFEDTEEVTMSRGPIDVHFRLSPLLVSKPYNPNDTSRKPAFTEDDPEFTLCDVPPRHKLILNKFCFVRPQTLLHTKVFESQEDLLTKADFDATWRVLQSLGHKYMAIFNGGPDAGSSVAHKHLQVIPKPSFKMFPETCLERDVHATTMEAVPFLHLFQTHSANASSASIYDAYTEMCGKLGIKDRNHAHNIVLTESWLLVLPCTTAMIDGLCQAGALAMIGQLWVKKQEQVDHWRKLGPMQVLERFGVSKQ